MFPLHEQLENLHYQLLSLPPAALKAGGQEHQCFSPSSPQISRLARNNVSSVPAAWTLHNFIYYDCLIDSLESLCLIPLVVEVRKGGIWCQPSLHRSGYLQASLYWSPISVTRPSLWISFNEVTEPSKCSLCPWYCPCFADGLLPSLTLLVIRLGWESGAIPCCALL